MESTKNGMLLHTPNLSNYRSTGESVTTRQRYIISDFIQSFTNQFNIGEQRFYSGAISNLSKHLKR